MDEELVPLLAEVGIHTLAELKKVGPGPAWMEIKDRRPEAAGLSLLWKLASAATGLRVLPEAMKQDLLDEVL